MLGKIKYITSIDILCNIATKIQKHIVFLLESAIVKYDCINWGRVAVLKTS